MKNQPPPEAPRLLATMAVAIPNTTAHTMNNVTRRFIIA
jgi:hypothetical protein